jgi:pyruvate carboxylase
LLPHPGHCRTATVHHPSSTQQVLEAMKMEHTLTAHSDGVVTGLEGLHVGSQVEDGQPLLRIVTPASSGGASGSKAAAAVAG